MENKYFKIVNKIVNKLEKGYTSTDIKPKKIPFLFKKKSSNLSSYFQEIENIPKGLNRNIKLIYKILDDNKKEIYLNEWKIFSLDEALSQYIKYCNDGQKNVFNIGYRYLGMGWIELLSCDLKTHLLFLRKDGGSNGWEREINYKNIIKNGSNKYKKIFFSDWFYNI